MALYQGGNSTLLGEIILINIKQKWKNNYSECLLNGLAFAQRVGRRAVGTLWQRCGVF